jgi:DNA-binding transcriptional regulator PaaX
MKTVEKKSVEKKKNAGRFGIQKVILKTLAHAGMLSVALLAPKALRAFAEISGVQSTLGFPQRIEKSTQSLLRAGEIEWVQTAHGKVLRLTVSGGEKLARLSLVGFSKKRRRWDGRWRMVLYDIREARKTKRQLLRDTLRDIGFYRLQDSVWVYPHECAELVLLLRTNFALGREVQYVEVDHIENDKPLIRHFSSLIL